MIWTVDIIDGANFSVKMCSTRAFSSSHAAHAYGEKRRNTFRHFRAAEGEQDDVFIKAITYEVHELELDDGEF